MPQRSPEYHSHQMDPCLHLNKTSFWSLNPNLKLFRLLPNFHFHRFVRGERGGGELRDSHLFIPQLPFDKKDFFLPKELTLFSFFYQKILCYCIIYNRNYTTKTSCKKNLIKMRNKNVISDIHTSTIFFFWQMIGVLKNKKQQ